MEPTYRVVFTGKFSDGSDPKIVMGAFARLANISIAKAEKLLSSSRTIKSGLDIHIANVYKKKLIGIGLEVFVKPEPAKKSELTLSLEPIDTPPSSDDQSKKANLVICPKCGHSQQSDEQCESCGVYIHKIVNDDPVVDSSEKFIPSTEQDAKTKILSDDEESEEIQDPNLKAVAVAAVLAVVCAYAWMLIAQITQYEVGIVAWAIGGIIGAGAIALGSAGMRTGIICGVLALCAILGGRYLVVGAVFDEVNEQFSSALGEGSLQEFWQQEIQHAQEFTETVHTDQQMREFMIKHDYSIAETSSEVGESELKTFKENDEPYLREMAANGNSDNYADTDLLDNIPGLSKSDLLWQSFGFIDILFLFLGVGTAFRIGAAGRLK